MGPKFEANFAIEIYLEVILLFCDKIWPKISNAMKVGSKLAKI